MPHLILTDVGPCVVVQWGQFKVTERTFTMPELQAAIEDGRVKEIFGSGTAATISPVAEIVYNGTVGCGAVAVLPGTRQCPLLALFSWLHDGKNS